MAPSLEDIDARLRRVEAVQELILRILSTTKPLSKVLAQYGATDAQEHKFYDLLDDLAVRSRGPDEERPSFAYFVIKLDEIFPTLRHDRQFVDVIVETLPTAGRAYKQLASHAAANGWPSWPEES